MTQAPNPKNDCTRCDARLDGTNAIYCYHTAFEETHPGPSGRPIKRFPLTPNWCPGMVAKDPALVEGKRRVREAGQHG